MELKSPSFFNRLLVAPRPPWATLVISLGLLSLPLLAISLEHAWEPAIQSGFWRPLFIPPVVIIYILLVSPPMDRSQAGVLRAMRPLVLVDDAAFDQLIQENTRTDSRTEWIAFAIGALLGAWSALSSFGQFNASVVSIYFLLSMVVLFGILAVIIQGSFADTRLNAALHHQPLLIDIFDTRPFEAVGRQSLLISLVFIGGITLSLIFGLSPESIIAWQVWLFYVPILLVPILLFFANMRDTHRVLAEEKKRILDVAQEVIRSLQRQMSAAIAGAEALSPLAAEYSAMLAYEARLKGIQTWPYDAPMLRTLFVAVLIPIAQRLISEIIGILS